jgi:two-component system, response regulator PdtaR
MLFRTNHLIRMLTQENHSMAWRDGVPLRVLIADDEPSVLAVLNHVIRFLGHIVIGSAINGKECVRRANELTPDLVIADLTMPGLDGIQAAEAISNNVGVPVLIVTGLSDPHVLERLENANIAGHLSKPFNLAQAKAAILAAVESHRAAALC